MKNTFHKNERLSSRKAIERLFLIGQSFNRSPLKLIAMDSEMEILYRNQVMFVAPKKKFKKAHDRNLLKRRMREAYRLQKNHFYKELDQRGLNLQCAIIFTGSALCDYEEIKKAMDLLLEQCVNKFKSRASNQIND